MFRGRFLFLITLGIFWMTAPVEACTCSYPDPRPCQRLPASGEAIFVGTVIRSEKLLQEEIRDPFGRTYVPVLYRFRFRVEERFAGNVEEQVDVYAGDSGLCGYHFELGESYVAFVVEGEGGRFWSHACTPTRPVGEAGALLPQLRAQRDQRATASLFGTLRQGALPEEEQDKNWSYEEVQKDQPLPFTAVHLRSENGLTWRSETGSQGEYAFFKLPAGNYRLWVGQDPDLATPPLQLPAGACHEYRYPFEAVPTGEIWGRVFDPKGEVLDEPVSLIRIEHYSEKEKGRVEYPDDNGYFHFFHVAPGKYYLVVNNENLTGSEQQFPRTFFPGTTKREEAIELELREDGRYPNADIRLKPAPPKADKPGMQ